MQQRRVQQYSSEEDASQRAPAAARKPAAAPLPVVRQRSDGKPERQAAKRFKSAVQLHGRGPTLSVCLMDACSCLCICTMCCSDSVTCMRAPCSMTAAPKRVSIQVLSLRLSWCHLGWQAILGVRQRRRSARVQTVRRRSGDPRCRSSWQECLLSPTQTYLPKLADQNLVPESDGYSVSAVHSRQM